MYNKYMYIYIYGTPPKKNDVFEVARLLGQITLFILSSSAGYHIYIYIYICVYKLMSYCWTQVLRAILSPKAFANVCKRVQGPKYLDWLRIQDSRFKIQDSRFRFKIQDPRFKIQDPRFKIQDPKKTSWIPGLGSGEFLDSRSFSF